MAIVRGKRDVRQARRYEELIPDDAGDYRDEFIDLVGRMRTGYWPHIGVPYGWYKIVSELNRDIRNFAGDYTVLKVDSDNGELIYNIRLLNNAVIDLSKVMSLISSAKARCETTCEVCGVLGEQLLVGHALKVVCKTHATQLKAKRRRKQRTEDNDDESTDL